MISAAPRVRVWNPDIKIMELPEDIFTPQNVHIFLNTKDYIWMRSADMYDIKDKEMFQDDIISCYVADEVNKVNCILEWKENGGLFIVNRIDGKRYNNIPRLFSLLLPEVIGNIYENPELMEEPPLSVQFIKDTLESLQELKEGKIEPYKFGEGE